MIDHYPTLYRDQFGEESTTIRNDGTTLRMTLRGVEFTGENFNAFEPAAGRDEAQLSSFTFDPVMLCACEIICDIPLPIVIADEVVVGTLHVHFTLGRPRPTPPGGLDREHLILSLSFMDHLLISSGMSGWFEDELLELQQMLPAGGYLKACICCAFSDYSPAGHDVFGGLACFRGHKAEYRRVKSKLAIFELWPRRNGYVQETSLCEEFELRVPGSGYRG